MHGLPAIFATTSSPPRPEADDASLMERIAGREDAALAALFNRYAQILYSLGFRILRSVPDAEDIVLEVFMQVWNKAESYQDQRGTVYTWLATMMRNKAIERLRSRGSRHPGHFFDVTNPALFADAASPGPQLHGAGDEDPDLVLGILKQMSIDQQRALALAYYEGFSQSEIALKLGIPPGMVKSHMRKGLESVNSISKGKA